MAREEARARVIEDSVTLVNMKVNDDGSINVRIGGSALADLGKAWSIVIPKQAVGNMEQPFFLLRNPSGSGKIVRLLDLVYSTDSSTNVLRFYRDPTITAVGTSITPVNYLKGAGAGSALAYKLPTISANGTLIRTEYMANKSSVSVVNDTIIRSLADGEDMLITVDGSNNANHYFTLSIGEE